MAETSPTLLERLKDRGDDRAWSRLVDLYSPYVRGWLTRHGVATVEADDLVQDVLAIVVRRFPDFEHNRRTGAFRAWLRTITFNRVREFRRAARIRPKAPGGGDFDEYLNQVEDPNHPLSKLWDEEHDLHVTRRLLEMMEDQFEPKTWRAFQLNVVEGRSPAETAATLGLTVNAVFIAKSRVLARLRREADGLIDSN